MTRQDEWARRLKEWRRENGQTQLQLGLALGVDPISVSRWERGQTRPRDDQAARILELTGIEVYPSTESVETELDELRRRVEALEAERDAIGALLEVAELLREGRASRSKARAPRVEDHRSSPSRPPALGDSLDDGE